jgi:dethiobiotin synthetase
VRGVFVTGTGTEVGKTVLAAAICAGVGARGERVAAFKPVVTGLDEPREGWLPDHELLAAVAGAGQIPERVAPLRFGPAVSPHLAAELARTRLEPTELVAAARSAGDEADALVCEGVGGLMVPLTTGYLVRDLAVDLDLPVVIAAPPGLGTINHSLLTVEAARAAGLDVRAVVLTPWPAEPSEMHRSNAEAIRRLGRVEVAALGEVGVDVPQLALAGATLPYERWLRGRSP